MVKSSKGALARRKGHDWERELVRTLQERGFNAERVITETKHGNIGDVVVWDVGLLVQCKAGKQPNLARALDEAEQAADNRDSQWAPLGGWMAIGACKKSLNPTTASRRVSMDLEDFLHLLELAYPT